MRQSAERAESCACAYEAKGREQNEKKKSPGTLSNFNLRGDVAREEQMEIVITEPSDGIN